ncbi:MAG: Phenylalanine--tRNA ligase alpha subunit [Elusimicrobia bacterium]|nr:Phenylalanine--tRNA ligase alpha subunit [Elusimicrobiota bacterium]
MDLESIEKDALEDLNQVTAVSDMETVYIKYLGRKEGRLTVILRNLGQLPPEEKKKVGQEANRVRASLEEKFSEKKALLESASLLTHLEKEKVDWSLPGLEFHRGTAHPILNAIREISDIFRKMGFDIAEGPEVETDQFNFTDLNIPENHPARDMHDTFYLEGSRVMRTHTSPVQVRIMRSAQPPIRLISPGRVFRHEATDATHAAIFHQIEGLVVDQHVSFSDLKAVLAHFSEVYFGTQTRVRFLPSYFPFVEPGAQMDVQCFLCQGTQKNSSGQACPLCKATGWIEMLGAGMVHSQVFRNVGIDPEKYSGFAFGMGVERILMTRSQVRDIRYFLESDIRFLRQFK